MKKFAVLGSGIGYTLSPKIHNAVFGILGADCSYSVEDIPQNALAENIERLFEEYDGLNVTKPFKKEIMRYVAADCAAVNTILCEGRKGYNTDGFGFRRALTRLAGDISGMDVLLLGGGGAAEVVASELTNARAKLTIYNRTKQKAIDLAAKCGASTDPTCPPQLIVNCTSAGLDGISSPLPPDLNLSRLRFAYDLIYSPPETPFFSLCKARGAQTANGLDMLIYQAIKADELFLNKKLDYDRIYAEIAKIFQA